jgi:hypothetical protein
MYLGLSAPGRLAAEMRWRPAVFIALLAIAAVAAIADAAIALGASSLHLTVKPRSGSPATRFAVSFRAGVRTGASGLLYRSYRVTASAPQRAGCRWDAAVPVPTAKQGARVRVTLGPGTRSEWCIDTYHGQVWLSQSVRCGPVQACPQIAIQPRLVGTFTFRVTRAH